MAPVMAPLVLAVLPSLIACSVFIGTLRLRGAKTR
jgi:hypothetical protein